MVQHEDAPQELAELLPVSRERACGKSVPHGTAEDTGCQVALWPHKPRGHRIFPWRLLCARLCS